MAAKPSDNVSLKRARQITVEYGKQTDYAGNLSVLAKNLGDSLDDASVAGKKLSKFLETSADLGGDFLESIDKVGTSEFMKTDFSKQIRGLYKLRGVLPVEQFKQLEDSLLGMKKGAESLERADTFSKNIANSFGSSAKSITAMVGKVPLIGKAFQDLADKKIDEITEGISNKIANVLTGGMKKGDGSDAPGTTAKNFLTKGGKLDKRFSRKKHNLTKGGKLDMRFTANKTKMAKTAKGAASIAKSAGSVMKIVKFLGGGILLLVVGLILKMAKGIFDYANKTGFSYAQTVKLGAALAINEKAVSAMQKEFGNINEVTAATALQMKRMSMQFAITEENAAAILRIQKAVSGATNTQLLNMQMATAELARQKGVAPADVFADIASSTEAFAKFSSDGGRNVMAAAVSAKALGINLSAVEKVADGLLDIESSIGKQMEASMLIGRELNLDRARQLALSGDLEGVLGEVRKQVGGEAEFNRLNVIQRQKLAAAVGLSTAELARLTTANANTLTAGAATTGAAVSEGVKAQVGAIQEGATQTTKAINQVNSTLEAAA